MKVAWRLAITGCDKIVAPAAKMMLTSGKGAYVQLRLRNDAESQKVLALC
jgi:hypothetical protein